jgi:hypothetical protein
MACDRHSTFVPFSPSNIGPDEIEEVVATLESGWLTTGPRVRRFESEFAAYTGAPHARRRELVHRGAAPVAARVRRRPG